MDEDDVKKQAQKYLEEKKGCIVIKKEFGWAPKNIGTQILDIVGITSGGTIYVVECKSGKIGRPLQGIGQLTRYRILIDKDSNGFKEKLKKYTKNNQKLQDRISKIDKLRPRIYLAVPKNRKDEWDKKLNNRWNKILRKCCKCLGFTKRRKFLDILMFSDEED